MAFMMFTQKISSHEVIAQISNSHADSNWAEQFKKSRGEWIKYLQEWKFSAKPKYKKWNEMNSDKLKRWQWHLKKAIENNNNNNEDNLIENSNEIEASSTTSSTTSTTTSMSLNNSENSLNASGNKNKRKLQESSDSSTTTTSSTLSRSNSNSNLSNKKAKH